MTDQRQIRRGGFYWFDGKPYVTVTTALKVVDKPALRWWFGKQVYQAMMLDPGLSEKEALAAPYRTTKKAANRGTAIHSIAETWKHSKKQIKSVPEKYRGYAQAFYDFVESNHINIIDREKTAQR